MMHIISIDSRERVKNEKSPVFHWVANIMATVCYQCSLLATAFMTLESIDDLTKDLLI